MPITQVPVDASGAVVYYELSWAILSTIGLTNVVFGLMVIGIVGTSAISLLPLIVSVACAVANGMCYYAFYANNPLAQTLVAAAVADVAWFVQEAGLSFYSYIILTRVLRSRSRTIFLSAFWGLVFAVFGLRMAILGSRVRLILAGSPSDAPEQSIVNSLHVAYFVSIALLEILSSVFLLRKFASAKRFSANTTAVRGGLFGYLMRSTEVRMAILAVIGTTRAVTYSFQTTAQSATNTAGQLDRFAYTLECMFPTIMFIDILASKLAFANDNYGPSSSRNPHGKPATAPRHFTQQGTINGEMYPLPDVERRIDIIAGGPVPAKGVSRMGHGHHKTSSQEHIVGQDDDGSGSTGSPMTIRGTGVGGKRGSESLGSGGEEEEIGISKTVEFAIYETQHRGNGQ